ncbi:MAG: hypothetical protein EAZ53_16350 [Bacteroidetes bacterium]|nr:MAG: hypothetical protein EAZ53_16350 [Bacteroidota bacterium]
MFYCSVIINFDIQYTFTIVKINYLHLMCFQFLIVFVQKLHNQFNSHTYTKNSKVSFHEKVSQKSPVLEDEAA